MPRGAIGSGRPVQPRCARRNQAVRIKDQLRIAVGIERSAGHGRICRQDVPAAAADDDPRVPSRPIDADRHLAARRPTMTAVQFRLIDPRNPSRTSDSGMNAIAFCSYRIEAPCVPREMSPRRCGRVPRTASRGIEVALPAASDDQRVHRSQGWWEDEREGRARTDGRADNDLATEPVDRLAHDIESDAAAGHIGHCLRKY